MKTIFTILLICASFLLKAADPSPVNQTNSRYSYTARLAPDTVPLNILPVTIVTFTAKWLNNEVRLDWSYADESASRQVIIERSAEGHEFVPIGTINIITVASHIRSFYLEY